MLDRIALPYSCRSCQAIVSKIRKTLLGMGYLLKLQPRIVLLNDHLAALLYGLGANTTHVGGSWSDRLKMAGDIKKRVTAAEKKTSVQLLRRRAIV